MATKPGHQGYADVLISAVAQAIDQLKTRPLAAVTLVGDLLAGDVLPWLAARERTASSLYLELSQTAEALTIIALRPSVRRAAASDLRLVRPSCTRWRARSLTGLVERARRLSSSSYAVVLTLESARNALLCDELDGAPLRPEHGGPWRPVIPDGQCFTSVKWVDRLEVTAEPLP